MQLQFILSGAGDTALYDPAGRRLQDGPEGQRSGLDRSENSTGLTQYVPLRAAKMCSRSWTSKIPNYANVKIKSAFNNDKVVPYRGTTAVFAYDSARAGTAQDLGRIDRMDQGQPGPVRLQSAGHWRLGRAASCRPSCMTSPRRLGPLRRGEQELLGTRALST